MASVLSTPGLDWVPAVTLRGDGARDTRGAAQPVPVPVPVPVAAPLSAAGQAVVRGFVAAASSPVVRRARAAAASSQLVRVLRCDGSLTTHTALLDRTGMLRPIPGERSGAFAARLRPTLVSQHYRGLHAALGVGDRVGSGVSGDTREFAAAAAELARQQPPWATPSVKALSTLAIKHGVTGGSWLMEVSEAAVDAAWAAACAALEAGRLGDAVSVQRVPAQAGFAIYAHTRDFSDAEHVARVLGSLEQCCSGGRASTYTSDWTGLVRGGKRGGGGASSREAQYTRDEMSHALPRA